MTRHTKAPPAPVAPVELDEAGDPEPSILEVERMLREADGEAPIAPVAAVPEVVAIPAATDGPHALDSAPVNSKVVVTEEGAFLATPAGVNLLPKTDPANRLPAGARIRKVADGIFVSTQLSATEDHPDQTYAAASPAIAGFVAHFHPSGLHS